MTSAQNKSAEGVTDPAASPSGKTSAKERAQEKSARGFRENQQLRIYVFVSAIIMIAWVFGALQLSFTYVFGLVALVFVVWRGKVMSLVEDHILQQETLLHRRRALTHHETTEWLNFIINRW